MKKVEVKEWNFSDVVLKNILGITKARNYEEPVKNISDDFSELWLPSIHQNALRIF